MSASPHRSNSRRALVSSAALAFIAPKAAFGQSVSSAEPLKLGVLPNVSIRVLMANYQPVRNHLEAELSQPVQIVSAADFKAFHLSTVRRDFDVVVTAGNLARIVELDHKWQPLVVFEPGIPGVLVRSKAKPPPGLAALRGKRLALANPQSMVALRGFEWLAEQGYKRDADYTTTVLRNDDSLFSALGDGDIPYAIMSMGEFRAMPDKVRATLEIETEFTKVMGFVVMAAPDISAERAGKLRAAWVKLVGSSHGTQFTALTGVRFVRALAPKELDTLDSFLPATRLGLAA